MTPQKERKATERVTRKHYLFHVQVIGRKARKSKKEKQQKGVTRKHYLFHVQVIGRKAAEAIRKECLLVPH